MDRSGYSSKRVGRMAGWNRRWLMAISGWGALWGLNWGTLKMAHSVTLSWQAPIGGDPAVSYSISRALVQAGPYTAIGTATALTFVDSGVTAGTTYFYEVMAVNTGGASGPSNIATATIPFSAPGVPTALTAVVA
jgi:hypothetical protein